MEEPRHSGFGIASAVLAGLAVPFFLLVFGVAGYQNVRSEGEPGEMFNFVIGMLVFLGLGICLVGGALGAVGLFQADRRRVLAVVGLVLNGVICLGVGGLIVFGMAQAR